jgi:hypothetical protein
MSHTPMNALISAFHVDSWTDAMPFVSAFVLFAILIVSFRARAVVFCQYLERMTGIRLSPTEVRRAFRERGQNGVREMFLDLIIREDLKEGPLEVPDERSQAAGRGSKVTLP